MIRSREPWEQGIRDLSDHYAVYGRLEFPGTLPAQQPLPAVPVPLRPPVPVPTGGRLPPSSKPEEERCYGLVQDTIAWDYAGNKKWDPANVRRLCGGTADGTQPAQCFQKVMHGGINWGGGTRWRWGDALTLCAGTNNAKATISCFEDRVRNRAELKAAIEACRRQR